MSKQSKGASEISFLKNKKSFELLKLQTETIFHKFLTNNTKLQQFGLLIIIQPF